MPNTWLAREPSPREFPYLYDPGALIAIDNNDRRMWARHHLALDEGRDIYIAAVVVSQAWRNAPRQVRLGKLLASCRSESVGFEVAKAAGVLCGKAKRADVVDATAVVMAAIHGAIVWTSDPDDIHALAEPRTQTLPRRPHCLTLAPAGCPVEGSLAGCLARAS
ncbi:type II toxin-antitoxin system VapC family toxin [Streptomyces sp. 6N223]|uniref:type II toxin-antitoxin system VapC family toxin n=1 Tax=Streptomyces sp. 6N223 TaxID=3457412 RepID=UPI003FD3A8BC